MGVYIGAGGAQFEIDVPEEGTPARENFDRAIALGDLAPAKTAKPEPAATPKAKKA